MAHSWCTGHTYVLQCKFHCSFQLGTPSTSTIDSSKPNLTRPPPQPTTEQRTNKPAPKPLPPLHVACWNGHYKVVKTLLDHGEPADGETNITLGTTPLIAACINGHVDIVELVLNRGAKVNLQDNNGWSALMVASKNGHSVVVNLLIDKGAEVNMQSNIGMSALMGASQNGHSVVVNLLIDKGAEVNMQDNDGWSALMKASQNGHSDIVNLLIDKGAEVNMQGNNGVSALMTACCHGQLETVRVLIENHADTSLQDIDGRTALGLACEHGHDEIVDILYHVKEQAEMDNSRASIQDESSEIRSVRNTEDTNDHTMNERIDLSDAAIPLGCHGNNHKQRFKPVTTEKANKNGASEDSCKLHSIALIWTKFYYYYSIHTPI